jgi:homogentisate 1,2-dioxygenase
VPYYLRVGDVPNKRHIVHRDSSGRLAEELVSQQGFAASSSLLYHRHSPSALTSVEALDVKRPELVPNVAVEPLHLRVGELPTTHDPVTDRNVLAGNDQVTLCWVRASTSSPLYRSAAGDELVFVQEGHAVLESVFGSLEVRPGDYVVIPASITHRWVLDGAGVSLFVVESRGHVDIPSRYLTAAGQLREGSPYSERDLRVPNGPLVREGDAIDVLVRHRGGWARHTHANHPFDVVGWDGYVYPYALSIRDFEPIVGRVHQPPPVHQTFSAPGIVVCSFVPRPLDFDPAAVPIPYHHSNVDSDEVLFYVDGDFTSRHGSGIGPGSMTVHPSGFAHGPQPGAVEAALGRARTDETAVMVDTFAPLAISDVARSAADMSYLSSWLSDRG